MRKLMFILIVFVACSAAVGTFFVLLPGPPGWVDASQVEGEVYAIELVLGQAIDGRDTERQAGIVVQYDPLTAPAGFTWDTTEPNVLAFTFTPLATGKYYATYASRPIAPHRGGLSRLTLAFWVHEALYHDPNIVIDVVD